MHTLLQDQRLRQTSMMFAQSFRNVLKVYEVVQTAADRVVYGPDAQHAKSRAASLFDNAPEIVLVVNVVGPWASVGIVTFWSILRHRTT